MARTGFTLPIMVFAGLLDLAGCAGADRPATAGLSGARRFDLTSEQNQVVHAGVRQMIGNPGNAQLKAVTAVEVANLPGIHVCGHVSKSGQSGKDLPFYIELREADGRPVAERGQVGSDPSKLSKVKFLCRRNAPGGRL